jgi:hypothetical protein
MNASNVVEIPSLLQSKTVKRLAFTKEGITIEKPLSFDPSVFIPTENVNAFRYGVKFTRGHSFVIGRQYFIETKDAQNKIFKIKLKSYYGIRREAYRKAWVEIINQLWGNYFSKMLDEHFELYNTQQVFEFAGIRFLFDGISWDTKNKLLWEEIALSNYKTYFMIHHVQNPKQHKGFNFSNDWNALVLQYLLKQIIERHK